LLKEHRAPGGISIHALTGHLEVTADGTTYDLPAGALLSLAAGVTHDVRALERSDMLLTVVRT
jgi:quercetin dioxygenase-like cupin family protein